MPSRRGVTFQPFEICAQIRGALITDVAIFLQAFLDDALQILGERRVDLQRRHRIAVQYGVEDQRGGFALKGQATGRELVQNRTSGKNIASGIDLVAAGLLRGNVGDGADGGSRTGEIFGGSEAGGFAVAGRCGVLFGKFGQAKIENLEQAQIIQKQIGGFDVAMNDALAMSCVEAIRHLNGDIQ